MKIPLLLCSALIASQLLYSQAPKGPGGNNLYKKGDCEKGGVNSNICIYCEDKELTKNCKEYLCTDNGTCTENPFKKSNDQLVHTKVERVKVISFGNDDTTSKLPPGTKFVNGKVTVRNGYKAVYSSDKKMVFITYRKGPNVKGSFSCGCLGTQGGSCSITIASGVIICGGDDCCRMVVTQSDLSGLVTKQEIEEAPEKLIWKRVVVPSKSN